MSLNVRIPPSFSFGLIKIGLSHKLRLLVSLHITRIRRVLMYYKSEDGGEAKKKRKNVLCGHDLFMFAGI